MKMSIANANCISVRPNITSTIIIVATEILAVTWLRRLVSAEVWVHAVVNVCVIFSGQSGTRTGFFS
jgi:hypothetical protein